MEKGGKERRARCEEGVREGNLHFIRLSIEQLL